MRTIPRIITFIVYLIAVVFAYLSSYGWVIERFSTVQYATDSLGIGNGNWITLVGYCIWTFGTMEYVVSRLQTNTFLVRLTILLLDVLAVPFSMVLFVLYNNTPRTGVATAVDVLNIFFLLMATGGLNGVFMLVLKIWEWLVQNRGNNSTPNAR